MFRLPHWRPFCVRSIRLPSRTSTPSWANFDQCGDGSQHGEQLLPVVPEQATEGGFGVQPVLQDSIGLRGFLKKQAVVKFQAPREDRLRAKEFPGSLLWANKMRSARGF